MRNILFLCTGNSARSIIAECLANHLGRGRIRAFSAGSRPAGAVHPFALRLLAEKGFETSALRSKSWEEFARPEAPRMDFVITVCDRAAAEACPVWPGAPAHAHWGIADPAAVRGDEAVVRAAFEETHDRLHRRVEALLSLLEAHPASAAPALEPALRTIGNLP